MDIETIYIDEPYTPYNGLARILKTFPDSYCSDIKPTVFNQTWSNKAKGIPFKYPLHEYMAKEFRCRVQLITKGNGDQLSMLIWDLGGGVRLAGCCMDPHSLETTPDKGRYWYMSLFFRDKETYNGCCTWSRLKEFLKRLESYDGEGAVQFVYMRISNVDRDTGLGHLKLTDYKPSRISNEQLLKKYEHHLDVYQCQHYDCAGEPYYVSEWYNKLRRSRFKPKWWPKDRDEDGFSKRYSW